MSDLFGDDSDSSLSDCDFDDEEWVAQTFESNTAKDSDESKNAEVAEENEDVDINFNDEINSFDTLEAIREIENLDFLTNTDGNDGETLDLENSDVNVENLSAEMECRNEETDDNSLELDRTIHEIERECSQVNADSVNNAAQSEALNFDCSKEEELCSQVNADSVNNATQSEALNFDCSKEEELCYSSELEEMSEVIQKANFIIEGNEAEHSISSHSNSFSSVNQFRECLKGPTITASPESQEKESTNVDCQLRIDQNQGNSLTIVCDDITFSIVVVKMKNIELGEVTNPIINRAYELSRKSRLPLPIAVPQVYDLYQFERLHEQPSIMYSAPQIATAPQPRVVQGIPTIPKQLDHIPTIPHQLNIRNIPTVPQFGLPQSSNSSSNNRAHQNVSMTRSSVGKRSRDSSVESWKYEEAGPSPKKRRRIRTAECYRQPYEVWQKDILEKEYRKNPNLDKNRRRDLAQLTNLCSQQVKVWFQNNRAKEKN